MRRALLLDRTIVEDVWEDLREDPVLPHHDRRIVGCDRWIAQQDAFAAHSGRWGVRLQPAHNVEDIAPYLPRLSLVALEFSGPGEGRGYTQARLLRERFGFAGQLRATGYVRTDQIFFLARCGVNAFELPQADLPMALNAFRSFSAAYQPSNDRGLANPLRA